MTDMQNMLAGMVRPLEWETPDAPMCHDHWSARAMGGAYHMAPDEDSPGSWVLQWTLVPDHFCMKYGGEITKHSAPESAQSAAQADYTARILAALDLDVIRALVGAAYEAAAQNLENEANEYSCGHTEYCHCHLNIEQMRIDADVAREMTPADAQAALDVALEKARREGLEMAAHVMSHHGSTTEQQCYQNAAAAIRKLGDGE